MRNTIILLFIAFFAISCSTSKSAPDYLFKSAEAKAAYIKSYDDALKLWDVPTDEKDVATSFGTAHVVMTGPESGKPVVLFHGMDASSTMWYPNVKALSKEYRVYSIDFPLEAGKSISSIDKLSNRQIAVFYNQVFKHFRLTDISLIGASRGGWMAVFLALQSENNISKMVLLSPAQTFDGLKKPAKILTAVRLKLFPNRRNLARFFNAFSLYPNNIDPRYKDQFYNANVYASSKPRFIKMLKFSRKELKSLKMPILVLVGDNDIVNDKKSIEKAHLVIPQVQTEMIDNAGHFLSIDQSDLVNKKIVDFLRK